MTTVTTSNIDFDGKPITAVFPTREEIAGLRVGDIAPTSLGAGRIKSIYARRDDINGHLFICYYASWGSGDTHISHSLKEDQLDRNVALTKALTSAECDALERTLRDQRKRAKGGA